VRYLKMLAFCVVAASSETHAGWLEKVTRDVGKTIEKSVQDVGKAIEKGTHDVGKEIENPAGPQTEHSPSDPCKNNPQLPQCDAVRKIER